MATYLKNMLSRKGTPQSQPIPGAGQVPNSAGGHAWAVDDWTRLQRFLVLGSEGGSYYASEQKLTLENAQVVERCLKADSARVVRTIVEISEAGRAPKADPALFALALATTDRASEAGRKAALAALPKVARTGTHLFHFAQFVDGQRGWGRGLRRAVADWYNRPAAELALQAVKYQARDGWSHRDLLRLAHPKADPDSSLQELYHWIVKGWETIPETAPADLGLVWAWERAKRAGSVAEIVSLIREYRLPREAVPTEWLTQAKTWEALLADMPMTAMIRNLATMTRVGLLAPGSQAAGEVARRLGDKERLRKARVHPIQALAALKTYGQGHGERGKSEWKPVAQVVDALDGAFYATFRNVPVTGKSWLLALDVSGSMDCGSVAGVPGLTPRVASAAMAMITAAVEARHVTVGFTAPAGGHGYGGQWGGGDPGLSPLAISPRQRLDDVCKTVQALPMGGTDCALPMVWALKQKLPVDVFVVYTDSETWAGKIHPVQALRDYRERMGIPARLIVVGMVSNGFSIADPNDFGMLDVVGFDTAAPALMSGFAAGEVA